MKPVATPGEYGEWGAWGVCDADCGPGTQTRDRPVAVEPTNGGEFPGDANEAKSCEIEPCPPPPMTEEELSKNRRESSEGNVYEKMVGSDNKGCANWQDIQLAPPADSNMELPANEGIEGAQDVVQCADYCDSEENCQGFEIRDEGGTTGILTVHCNFWQGPCIPQDEAQPAKEIRGQYFLSKQAGWTWMAILLVCLAVFTVGALIYQKYFAVLKAEKPKSGKRGVGGTKIKAPENEQLIYHQPHSFQPLSLNTLNASNSQSSFPTSSFGQQPVQQFGGGGGYNGYNAYYPQAGGQMTR